MNVRAPRPDTRSADAAPEDVLQVSVHDAKGWYRIRAGVSPASEGYSELGRHDLSKGIGVALEHVGDGPYFVVLENEDTGEVFYEADHNLSDNWSDGGRFDVITLFSSEEEAAAYADERRGAHED